MSFILDALKKSEIERQRQSIPGLVDTGGSRPRRRPTWAIALAALLAVNLLVLILVLMRGSGAARNAAPAQTAAQTAQSGPPRAAPRTPETSAPKSDHFSPMDAPPVYAPEIPVDSAPADRVQAPPAAEPAQEAAHAAHRRDPVLTEGKSNAADNDEETLPSINELNLTGERSLPELHLDVHVFATKASDRFVYINMRKYREGATLQEGPALERIRRDGVVLNYQGLRFLLPRQ
jgi:general secretion pathway protein B